MFSGLKNAIGIHYRSSLNLTGVVTMGVLFHALMLQAAELA
jgi:hypothetical protein